MTTEELMSVAEVKITYSTKIPASKRPKVCSSEDVVEVFRKFYEDDYEYAEKFYVMYLNRANKVIGVKFLSSGSSTGTVVCSKMIAQGAVLAHANNVILCHNHPSGNTKPSDQDLELTRKVREGLKFLDIQLLDHIIITREQYLSFADEGIN